MTCPSAIFIIWKSPNWLIIQTNPALDCIAVLPEAGFQVIYSFPSGNNVAFYKAFNNQNWLWTKLKRPEIDQKSFMNRLELPRKRAVTCAHSFQRIIFSYICLHKPGTLTICPQNMAYFTQWTRTRIRTFRKSERWIFRKSGPYTKLYCRS